MAPELPPEGAHVTPIYARSGISPGRFWISLEVGVHVSLLFVMKSLVFISSVSVCEGRRGTTFCDQHRVTGSQGGFSLHSYMLSPRWQLSGAPLPAQWLLVVMDPGENWSPAVHSRPALCVWPAKRVPWGSPGFPCSGQLNLL